MSSLYYAPMLEDNQLGFYDDKTQNLLGGERSNAE
jgi:hypothetical protein